MEILIVSIFHVDILKSAPCSSANTQTHRKSPTVPYAIVYMREKGKTKGERQKTKKAKL